VNCTGQVPKLLVLGEPAIKEVATFMIMTIDAIFSHKKNIDYSFAAGFAQVEQSDELTRS